jgi:purine-binding chemotaxis protein CheW
VPNQQIMPEQEVMSAQESIPAQQFSEQPAVAAMSESTVSESTLSESTLSESTTQSANSVPGNADPLENLLAGLLSDAPVVANQSSSVESSNAKSLLQSLEEDQISTVEVHAATSEEDLVAMLEAVQPSEKSSLSASTAKSGSTAKFGSTANDEASPEELLHKMTDAIQAEADVAAVTHELGEALEKLSTDETGSGESVKAGNQSLAELIASVDQTIAQNPIQIGDAAKTEVKTGRKYLVFQVRDAVMGLALEDILQVDYVPVVTPLPISQKGVLGVVNFRGEVLPLLDLRLAFNDSGVSTKGQKMVVARCPKFNAAAGLVVDGIKGLLPLAEETKEEVLEADSLGSISRTKYRHEDQPIHVLDVNRFLELKQYQSLRG